MRRRFFVGALPALLAGCSPINAGLDTLQLNNAAITLPANYRQLAQGIVEGVAAAGPMSISEPGQIAGEAVYDARRGYVCVRGLDPKGKKPAKPTLRDLAEHYLLMRPNPKGIYDVIVIFSEHGPPSTIQAFDSPLCEGRHFELRGQAADPGQPARNDQVWRIPSVAE